MTQEENDQPKGILASTLISGEIDLHLDETGGPSKKARIVNLSKVSDFAKLHPGLEELGQQVEKQVQEQRKQAKNSIINRLIGLDLDLPREGLEAQINTPEDAFVYLVNNIHKLNSQISALENSKKELEETEQSRQESDKKFMRNLEVEVTTLFVRLQNLNDDKKADRIAGYKELILRHLNSKYDNGFKLEDRPDGLSINFTNPQVAFSFYNFYNTFIEPQFEQEIVTLYTQIHHELESKGLKALLSQASSEEAAKSTEKRRIKLQAAEGELNALPPDLLVKQCLTLTNDTWNLEKVLREFKPQFPDLEKLETAAEMLVYLSEEFKKIGLESKNLKESVKTYRQEQERSNAQNEALRKDIRSLEESIKSNSSGILKLFELTGEYLRKHNLPCDFGYEIPQAARTDYYLASVASAVSKFSSAFKEVIDQNSTLKKSQVELEKIIDNLREQMLESNQIQARENSRFKTFFSRLAIVGHFFNDYVRQFNLEAEFPNLAKTPELAPVEELINCYYLPILSEGLSLIQKELPTHDESAEINRQKESLLQKYNCSSLEELEGKLKKIDESSNLLEKQKEFEEKIKKYSESGATEHDSYHEIVARMQENEKTKSETEKMVKALDPKATLEQAQKLSSTAAGKIKELRERENQLQANYTNLKERFHILLPIGQAFGLEITSCDQLKNLLEEEKEKYEACAMAYKLINSLVLGKD